jgi:rhodanese-related sulfurtransferase
MTASIKRIDAKTLKSYLHDGDEIALLDAREEVPFDDRHILMASCVPLGRLEAIVPTLLPRRSVRVVWCDDGEGLAEPAAMRMAELGYSDVSLLEGGVAGWGEAGYRIYNGVHVPSKAFAEVIEHEAGTPYISADELKEMMDSGIDMALFDSRSYEEYHVNSIPTAISVPGAELVYRFKDMVSSPDTTVVVNCGGRTRSIIGAQALIAAGFPNKIMSLMNGTQGWHLAGHEVIVGATNTAPEVSPEGLAAAQEAAAGVAERHGIATIDMATLKKWQGEADKRTLYVLDVRTLEEYEAGHMPEAKHIAGGQLVQETDRHLGAWGARVVLVDAEGVRAVMTASWLKQMGWDVSVLKMDKGADGLATGPFKPVVLGLDAAKADFISPADLQAKLSTVAVADLGMSKQYFDGHIPGAHYLRRSTLAADIGKLPDAGTIVLTSPDGTLAQLAAADAAAASSKPVLALEGGTAAWQAAGYDIETGPTNLASEVNDIRIRAREMDDAEKEKAMEAYLAWEINLVNQMATDDDQRFDVISK